MPKAIFCTSEEVRAGKARAPFAPRVRPQGYFFEKATELFTADDEMGLLILFVHRGYHLTDGCLRERRYWQGTPPEVIFLIRCFIGPKPFQAAEEYIGHECRTNPDWKKFQGLASALLSLHEFHGVPEGSIARNPLVKRLAKLFAGDNHDNLAPLGQAMRLIWKKTFAPGW